MDVEQLNTKKVVRRMGARRRAQGGALAPLSPGKVVQLFSALLMTVKRSVDELFMHYFQNIRRLLESSPPDLHRSRSFIYGPRSGTEPPDPLIAHLE